MFFSWCEAVWQSMTEHERWRLGFWSTWPPATFAGLLLLTVVTAPITSLLVLGYVMFRLAVIAAEMIGEWWEIAASLVFGILGCVLIYYRKTVRFARLLTGYSLFLAVVSLACRELAIIRREKRAVTSHFRRQLWLLPPGRRLLFIPLMQAFRNQSRRE